MTRGLMRALMLTLTLTLTLSGLVVRPLQAHELSIAHVAIDAGEDVDAARPGLAPPALVRLELELSLRDIALSLPLDTDRNELVTWGELQQARSSLETMAAAGLSLSSSVGACVLQPRTLAVRRYDSGAYAVLGMDARCPSRLGLRFRYDLLFDGDPAHRAIVTLRDDDATRTVVVDNVQRDIAFSTAAHQPFSDFLVEGVRHILGGYDHLAFLLSLLLPAALVRLRGAWSPVQDSRHSAIHIFGIVTAFTAAHSITLSLSALGWVVPASQWIEPVIAASVLLAALNNIRPWVTQRLWMMGFAFGLIHGFGFAGALSELGLPQNGRLLSLLGFNLGVELGQLAVVCVTLPLLFLVREKPWYSQRVMPLLSSAIALMAVVWLWQRLVAG